MSPSRPFRPTCLRRSRGWAPLLLAVLWRLLGCLLLLGAPVEGDVATHRVREGDTLLRLCWQYKVRAEAIRAANPGVVDPLPVGRKLTIPLGPYDPAARVAEPPARPAAKPRKADRPPHAVQTTRLPPQPPESPTPVRRPVTVVSVEASRP